jgi:hypothetical protein
MNYQAAVNITAQYSGKQAIQSASKDLKGLAGDVGFLKNLELAKLAVEGSKKFLEFAESIINFGNEMRRLSEKTGIGVQTLSDLKTSAELAGLDIQGLDSALKKFSLTSAQAEAGNKKALGGFQALGISLKGANGDFKTTDQLLLEVADKFKNAEDGPKKVAAAVALMGKNGADAIPLLDGGSESIHKMGVVISREFLDASKEFHEHLVEMKVGTENLGVSILEKLLPPLNSYIEKIKNSKGFFATVNQLFGGFVSRTAGRDLDEVPGAGLVGTKGIKEGSGQLKTGKINTSFLNQEQITKEVDALKKLTAQRDELAKMNALDAQKADLSTAEYSRRKIALEENLKAEKEIVGFTPQGAAAYRAVTEEVIHQKQALIDLQEQQKTLFSTGAKDAWKAYSESARDVATQTKTLFTDAFTGMEDAFVSFARTGKLSFKNLADSVISDLARIAFRQALVFGIGSLFSGGAAAAGGAASGLAGHGVGSTMAAFADGGIMTARGRVALRKYASGGIANSPQMAMFGEGSRPEAFVPLPDGRRIPVAMSGGGNHVAVTVNMDQSGGNTKVGSSAEQGRQLGKMVGDAVKQKIMEEQRPGGLLFNK